jgi:hypothetical protein
MRSLAPRPPVRASGQDYYRRGLITVPMNQPLVIPNLETGTEIREHIQAMCSLYRRLIAVMLDVMRRIDVVPVIEEMHAIQSHLSCLTLEGAEWFDRNQRGALTANAGSASGGLARQGEATDNMSFAGPRLCPGGLPAAAEVRLLKKRKPGAPG